MADLSGFGWKNAALGAGAAALAGTGIAAIVEGSQQKSTADVNQVAVQQAAYGCGGFGGGFGGLASGFGPGFGGGAYASPTLDSVVQSGQTVNTLGGVLIAAGALGTLGAGVLAVKTFLPTKNPAGHAETGHARTPSHAGPHRF